MTRLPVVLLGAFGAGDAACYTYLRTMPVASRFQGAGMVEFGLWIAVLGAVGGLALAALAYFVLADHEIRRLTGRDWRVIVPAAAAVIVTLGAVIALLLIGTAAGPSGLDRSVAIETRPITIGAAACMIPGLIGFLLVRAAAGNDTLWTENGQARVKLLLRCRLEERRLLAVLGAFLTVLVISTGLRRRALLARDAGLNDPPEAILLYGLVFAIVLGLFYYLANSAVDARASTLVDEFAPIPAPEADDLSTKLSRRNDLSTLVGLGGVSQTFQSSVIVAAPLLTALISTATG